jgi:PIN domain nuclease of toxin-antitoxin system
VASAWEIVVKHGLGELRLPLPPAEYIPERLTVLGHRPATIELRHVLQLARLPLHHRDPFDRVLVAQAVVDSN